jgi:hypothetical protein
MFFREDMQNLESGSAERVVERRELDKLVTWTGGYGVVVQVPFNSERRDTIWYKLIIRCVHVSAVAVGKQKMLNIPNECFYCFISCVQSACAVLYFRLYLVSLCHNVVHYCVNVKVIEYNWTQYVRVLLVFFKFWLELFLILNKPNGYDCKCISDFT